MSSVDLALLPIFLPLAGASLALAAKATGHGRVSLILEGLGATLGLLLPWGVLGLLLPVALGGGVDLYVGSWHPAIGIAQSFDGLAWLMDLLIFAGAGTAYLYSRGAGPRGPVFTTLFLIQTSALAASASTADLFNLFVCLELVGLASYVLVASSEKGGAFLASFRYLAVSSASMVFFLFGILGLYRLTGALSYRGIAAGLAALEDGGGATAALSVACVTAAVVVRCALMPVYGWLPDAHGLAPHAVSALLSGVLLKVPLFALSRLLLHLPSGPRAMELIGFAGTATALVAVTLALAQKDAKRLLAWHSISQMGYVAAAWGLGTLAGLTAAFLHALFHALFKGILFLSVGTATDAAGDRDVYSLRGCAAALAAAGDRRQVTTIAFAVGALSIVAVPPFNGFASKAVLGKLFAGDPRYWILFVAGIGTAGSFLKLGRLFLPRPGGGPPPGAVASYRVRPSMKTAMLLLAGLCLVTGVFAAPLFDLVRNLLQVSRLPSIAVAPGTRPAFYTPAELIKTAATLALGGVVFFAATRGPGVALAHRLRGLPRSFAGLILGFCAALAGLGAYLVLL